jgi:hypothetical protein
MKRVVPMLVGLLAVAASAFAQSEIDRALAAAPAPLKADATVIKWKSDGTYDTLKKGTNRLVCYDRSNEAGRPAFAVQCTSVGNLDRVAQNRKFEQIADRAERQKALDEAEKNGSRVKPEYGSVFYMMNGPDQASARVHATVALPGATTASTGLPDNNKQGGAWIMAAGTSTAHLMTPGH